MFVGDLVKYAFGADTHDRVGLVTDVSEPLRPVVLFPDQEPIAYDAFLLVVISREPWTKPEEVDDEPSV